MTPEFERALARDLERLQYALLYALFNGGNLPPEFADRHLED